MHGVYTSPSSPTLLMRSASVKPPPTELLETDRGPDLERSMPALMEARAARLYSTGLRPRTFLLVRALGEVSQGRPGMVELVRLVRGGQGWWC